MSMVTCKVCGKQIHETAPVCPKCGTPQDPTVSPIEKGKIVYSSYDQVPWHRKNWFAFVCAFILTPGLLIILLTGDVYYEVDGKVKTYSKVAKVLLVIWCISQMIWAIKEL